MRSSTSVIALLAGLLFLPAMQPQDATDKADLSAPTAAQVLERMTKTYASCKSYRESNDLHIELNNPAVDQSRYNIGCDMHAEIAFVRPDKFRFESTNVLCRSIVWRQGATIRSWTSMEGKVETKRSLKDPLEAFFGISGGVAMMIPGLLLPDELGSPLSKLVDIERRRDDSVKGSPCFQIFGKVVKSDDTFLMTVWIDQHTFLVRQVAFKAGSKPPKFTITIDGKIDVDVSDKDLAFDPNPPK